MSNESLEHTLGRIDERTRNLVEVVTAFSKATEEHLKQQDNKIEKLHNWKAQMIGASLALTTVSTILLAIWNHGK